MDLFVERQYIEAMKGGDYKKFLNLFEENFDDLYRYVARRVSDRSEVERIVRMTFLDAFGQIPSTPTDISYIVWLYSLARSRTADYIAKSSFPDQQGLISADLSNVREDEVDLVAKADKMMGKLSLEEREILRLKFFEQVTDGDVMRIIEADEAAIGQRIYRVLKRAHFLLFGDSDGVNGVYFGELAGFFERLRGLEDIKVLDVLRLNLKLDLSEKIGRKDFAIDGEAEQVETVEEVVEERFVGEEPQGSDDPAKIFVKAVEEMREEEAMEAEKERERFERNERIYDFIDQWKAWLIFVPVILLFLLLGIVVWNILDFQRPLPRFIANTCDFELEYEGDFSKDEKKNIQREIGNRFCDELEVDSLLITKIEEGKVNVEAGAEDWILSYDFVMNKCDWRIKKYERLARSN